MARNDIARVIDRMPGERDNPHVAERVLNSIKAPGGVFLEHCLAALLDVSDLRNPRKRQLRLCINLI